MTPRGPLCSHSGVPVDDPCSPSHPAPFGYCAFLHCQKLLAASFACRVRARLRVVVTAWLELLRFCSVSLTSTPILLLTQPSPALRPLTFIFLCQENFHSGQVCFPGTKQAPQRAGAPEDAEEMVRSSCEGCRNRAGLKAVHRESNRGWTGGDRDGSVARGSGPRDQRWG